MISLETIRKATGLHIALGVFCLVVVVDLLFLNFKILNQKNEESLQNAKAVDVQKIIQTPTLIPFAVQAVKPIPQPTTAAKITDSCYPFSCVDLIRQATASIGLAPTASTTTDSGSVGPREYFIPLGNGQTTSDSYQDIYSAQANIDTTKYSGISSVTFEATMEIPTANGIVYAQLFDTTDKHPVWFSEVSMEGNTPKLLVSKPITLGSGNHLYRIQMKTTLKYTSILDQARVHIIAQ